MISKRAFGIAAATDCWWGKASASLTIWSTTPSACARDV